MSKINSFEEVGEWNKKLYKNRDGTFLTGKWNPKYLDRVWNIKSWPLYPDGCAFHLPPSWEEEVEILLHTLVSEYPDIKFLQIKEKWAELVIYYEVNNQEDRLNISKLIAKCQEQLRAKGLHP